ncbi:MAG: flagellar biosynthetic protein FliQ [Planctomycetota bacterium]|jgi:flagellar biosynthetic protein FliQ
MGPEAVGTLANQMLFTVMLCSMPLLLTALVVGVFISLIQTVTNVQEMTLTFVPKVMAVGTVLIMALPWIRSIIIAYTQNIFILLAGG